ncbi:amidase [Haloarchaeobius iranensis]|uniref:Aspartyl-tRNA(Asn)/glutamyl-tRNA(Gln) amidotransferase subunit A n=1 Tax=Haloarchaeobius iranensis TaxID=996166 RepID=A0A1G9YND4_9EURY|nr:amidase [Haloarchaeobius iranensis]SDN10580.1 aspartyl-tRNA(Asn)/glutamyl-tRNA(Gln) amidotransferase subunit A [Haloarchaeobius iranensis]
MPTIDRHDVEAVVRRYGLATDDEAVDAYLEATAELATQYGGLAAEQPAADTTVDPTPGDDEHNAFRYRFELGGGNGALSDLDLAVKENIVVAGVPSTCGSPGFEYEPPHDATVVDRLVDDGATLVGTTNMDEFAFYITGETCAHGRTSNPTVEGCVPGGSSSGSGAAVAAGLVDAALGTDTGGSVRIPASFCGVVGIKPTHQRVSRFGVVDLSHSLDHVGPLAGDVETAARVLETIAGPDGADPSTRGTPEPAGYVDAVDAGVDGLDIGVVTEAMATSEDAVADRVSETVAELEAAGATAEEVSLAGYPTMGPAVGAIAGMEFAAFVGANGASYSTGTGTTAALREALAAANERGEFGENVAGLLVTNGVLAEGDGAEYVAAKGMQRQFSRTVGEALEDYDVLVMPTTPITAPEFGELEGMDGLLRAVENTAPFNCSGTPAVSVPCGSVDGKPVGLQVVADWNDETTALRVAGAVESL